MVLWIDGSCGKSVEDLAEYDSVMALRSLWIGFWWFLFLIYPRNFVGSRVPSSAARSVAVCVLLLRARIIHNRGIDCCDSGPLTTIFKSKIGEEWETTSFQREYESMVEVLGWKQLRSNRTFFLFPAIGFLSNAQMRGNSSSTVRH